MRDCESCRQLRIMRREDQRRIASLEGLLADAEGVAFERSRLQKEVDVFERARAANAIPIEEPTRDELRIAELEAEVRALRQPSIKWVEEAKKRTQTQ